MDHGALKEYCPCEHIACSANCTSCTSSASCTSCVSGMLVYQGYCVSECPIQYFSNGENCLACDPDCVTCTGSSSSACTSCSLFRTVQVITGSESNSTGQCICLPGTYEYPNTTVSYQLRQCWTCDISCAPAQCVIGLPTQCISCNANSNYTRATNGSCIIAPPVAPTSSSTSSPTINSTPSPTNANTPPSSGNLRLFLFYIFFFFISF
jgi:hypothetical protein